MDQELVEKILQDEGTRMMLTLSVADLSGHKEGSKAFARYRDIDEEMKTDLVKLLEK